MLIRSERCCATLLSRTALRLLASGDTVRQHPSARRVIHIRETHWNNALGPAAISVIAEDHIE